MISGVLTLPGIAALILGVGMAVDANIIMYERIKDELRIGRNLKQAYKKASAASLWTIIDANITTLVAGVVLFAFGTSSVKGFATMLLLSILMSFITAVFLTRLLLSLLIKSGFFNNRLGWFGVKEESRYSLNEGKDIEDLTTPWDRFDFVGHSRKFFAFSLGTVLVGLLILSIFRLNLGIDFTSGTRADIQTDGEATVEQVEDELEAMDLSPDSITTSGDNMVVVRYAENLPQDDVTEMQSTFDELYGSEPAISTVSPVIGQELAKNAVISLAIASIGIILYATIRFEWRMALPSVLALIHDAFIMIAIFSIFRLEVDITFIAAVLTIIGYSINDTIVTFDRVRENLRKYKVIRKEEEIDTIINRSLKQTLTRSVNTVLTVIIVVVFLVLFGSTAILNFSIALLVGLISGIYSSLFIALQLWGILKKRQLRNADGALTVYEEKSKDDDKILV